MNRMKGVVGGVVVLAAVAFGVPTQSAPAQVALLPDGEDWQPVTELQEWENSSGRLVCTGECPGESSSCCSVVAPY